jgi:hypothetical protein
MTSRSDVERVLDRYLAEGGEQVPDRVVDAALDQIDHIPQRRALRVPWRFTDMPSFMKPALAGAAVIAALVVGGMFLNRGPTDTAGGRPIVTPLPSASAPASGSPSPSASPALTDTSNWVPFTSQLYGYKIAHPPTWTVEPATRDWSLEDDRTDWVGHGVADGFLGVAAGLVTRVTAFADDVPPGMSEDEWLAAYYVDAPARCGPSDDVRAISVDGHPGRFINAAACDDAAQAFVFLDGRVHGFAIWRPDQEALLEAFLSTVEFQQ